jgi:hypothetical protein
MSIMLLKEAGAPGSHCRPALPGATVSRSRPVLRQSGTSLRSGQRGVPARDLRRDGLRVHPEARSQDASWARGPARQGLSAGGIAYGYRREPLHDHRRQDRDGHPYRVGGRWVVEPREAEIVTTIFRWYADGLGMGTITSSLNARAIPCPRQPKGRRIRHDSAGNGWGSRCTLTSPCPRPPGSNSSTSAATCCARPDHGLAGSVSV